MAVNRYSNHLVVYLEDKPYRELVNGAKTLENVNEKIIDDKNPCGGWSKVLKSLTGNLNLINSRHHMHVLLLIDFDNEFEKRKEKFKEIILEEPCFNRVFLLGIDLKESEDLKRTLNQTNNEVISQLLLKDCPNNLAEVWENDHLRCNQPEIERMRASGVFEWLFKNFIS